LKCPECGKEIDGLLLYTTEYNTYWAYIEDGEIRFDTEDSSVGDEEFVYPECHATLFYDEEEAEAFLKGERK